MKKSKLTALIISAAMAMQTMPMFTWGASAADEIGTIPNMLNFENIEAGTSADTLEGITISRGTATIEKDEHGTNAIKISTGSILKFNLDSSTNCGHTVVEYKFRSVNHTNNAQLYEFGTLIGQNEQRILKSRIYNQNMNVCKGSSSNENDNSNIVSLSASESYVTMTYVVDHTNKNVDVYVDGTAKLTDIPYFHTVNSAPVMLLFDISYGTASTFYIDDIRVNKVAKTASGWDFENDTFVGDISGLSTSASGTVVTEADGNKALKLSGNNQESIFNFPTTQAEKVLIEYDVKAVSLASPPAEQNYNFGIARTDTTNVQKIVRYSNTLLPYSGTVNAGGVSIPTDTYKRVTMLLDMTAGTYTIAFDGDQKTNYTGKWNFANSATSVNNLYFTNVNGDTILLDNIRIKEISGTANIWDFENDPVVSEISGLTTSGTVALVEEETGNKALKATGSNGITFTAPATTKDRVEIEYKFKVEAYAKNTAQYDFGAVRNGSTNIVQAQQYNSQIIGFYGSYNSTLYSFTSDDTQWHTVKYVLDMVNQNYMVYVDGVQKLTSMGNSAKWGFKNSADTVNKLYFNSQSGNTIYFDDIKIREVETAANEWTFEDASSTSELPSITITGTNEITEDPQDITNHALKLMGANNVTFNAPKTTKGKVTVEYDYKTVTKGTSMSDQILFGAVRYGTSQIVRAINYSGGMNLFHGTAGSINILNFADNETAWTNIKYVIDFNSKKIETYKNGEEYKHWGGENKWDFYASNSVLNNIFFDNQAGQVIYLDNIKITEDESTPLNPTVTSASIANNSTAVALDAEFALTFSKAVTIDEGDVTVTANGKAVTAVVTPSEDGLSATIAFDKAYDTTYVVTLNGIQSADGGTLATYTNTFSTEAPYVSVKNTTIADGAEGVYKEAELKLTFNKAVSAINASVTANGKNVVSMAEVAEDGLTATIVFDKACETTYTVTVNNAIGTDKTDLEKAYVLTFTTEDSYTVSDISISNSVTDKQIEIEVSIANNGVAEGLNYNVYAAIYDGSNALESVKKADGTLAIDKADFVSIAMDKPEKYTADHKVKVFVWDNDMNPLADVTEVALPQARTYGYDNYVSEDVTALNVAFLGGSITEQTDANGYSDYVVSNFDWNGKTVNRANRVNNGVGGTTSELGMHRVSKDIISSNPDVVFIDYAVNDCSMPSSEQAGETMENIIRQLMKLDHQPMIILAHMPTKSQGELTKTIPTFNALAEKYGIGYINVAQYIADEVTAGTYTWDTTDTTKTVISGDGVHPNSNGAAAYGAYIVEQLTNSPASYFKKMTELADAQYSALNFNAPKLVAHTAGQYTGWWTESTSCNNRLQANVAMAQKNGDSVTYKFVGSAIGLYMVKNPTGATASYSIDDGAVTGTVDASLGLSMPQYERLAAGLDYGVHTVTITLTEDGSFGIGYFCED